MAYAWCLFFDDGVSLCCFILSDDEGLDKFDPWGKPGAGAPLRDGQGQVRACGVYGKHSRDMEKKSAHLTVTVDKTATARGDGFDMATWMRAKHEDPKLNKNQLLEESVRESISTSVAPKLPNVKTILYQRFSEWL